MQGFKKHLEEKLKASDDMGTWVKDFQDSDAPQFKGKSQKKRQQMAVAAKLSAERNEEVELDEVSDLQKDFISSMQSKLKKRSSLRDPNAKTAREEDKLAKQLAAKAKMKKEEVELEEGPIKAIGTAFKKYKLDKEIRKTAADREQMIRQSKTNNYQDYAKEYEASLAKRDALKKQLKSLSKKEEVELDEAKLSPQQRDRLDDLILNVHMTTHPEYDGEETPGKYLKAIEKEFGAKVAKQVKDGIEIAHWGRDNHSSGNDKLSWRKGGARITKSGKMNKQDVEALKNRIKRDKAWGGITKKVKLPEEVELDEAAPKLKGDWLKKEREKNREHDAAMGRTPTGRKKPVRQMTSTQRSLAKMRGEEVELDEVLDTPKAMDSYKNKAKYSKDRAANSAAAKMLRNKNGFHSTDTSQELKTMDKRTKGLKMADKNAMKKTFKALRGEEVEQIDELKKSTLASYVNKASDDRAQNALEIGKSGKINFKGLKRRQGIQRATKRLAKEEFELDEAQLDKMKKISPGFDDRKKAERHNDHLVSKKKASNQSYVAKIGNKYHVVDMKEEVDLDEQTQYDLVEAYLLENNIDVDTLSVEQLDEIIGKVVGGAFKVGAKAAVGAARGIKKAANRMTVAGRADAAEKRADAAEKRNKDRERIQKARDRLRDAQNAARDNQTQN